MIVKSNDVEFALYPYKQYLTGHNGFIAGGCFKDIFQKRAPKDLDIFFESREDFEAARTYFDGDSDYKRVYNTKRVTAYKNTKTGITLELNKFLFGKPEDVVTYFDFTIVKYVLYSETVPADPFEDETPFEETATKEYRVFYDDKFFEHLFLKRLVIDDRCPHPLSTFERVIKYSKYGFSPCRETKAKLARAIAKVGEDADIENGLSQSFYDGVD